MMANRRLPHWWRQFRALDAAERWLIIEAFMLMALIQVGFRTMPFAMLRRWLDKGKGRRGAAHPQARIAWAVNAAGRRLPGRTCLSEALAADVTGVLGGPHDIAFSVDGNRAYVASENNWSIWDATPGPRRT